MQKGFSLTKLLLHRVVQENTSNASNANNPAVLSCGGIYLPRRKETQKIICHVLNVANQEEPTKIYSNSKPSNILYEVLVKEILN